MLAALATAMSAMVFGSVDRTSRFGKRRDLASGSSWTLRPPFGFVCVDCNLSPALSTVCESEAANKSAIANTNTPGISFLIERGESKDIKSSLVLVLSRFVAHDHPTTGCHEE